MGRKKKNRGLDYGDQDDDLLAGGGGGGGSSENDNYVSTSNAAAATATATPALVSETGNKSSDLAAAGGFDLVSIRSEMKSLLRLYPSKPDDWLHRTLEKNLKLRKKSLKPLEDELESMRAAVEDELDDEQEREGDDAEGEKELLERELAKIRAEARMAGRDPEEAVKEALLGERNAENKKAKRRFDDDGGKEEGGGAVSEKDRHGSDDGGGVDSDAALSSAGPPPPPAFLVALLLSLRPHAEPTPSPADGSRPSLRRRQRPTSLMSLVWALMYAVLRVVLARSSALREADEAWERDAPKRDRDEADDVAKDAEAEAREDDKLRGTHLWCSESGRWVNLDGAYRAGGDDDDNDGVPMTIRRSPRSKGWERWSKNLKTVTKASKTGAAMTRGAWLPVRPGEGWATAPGKAESDDRAVTNDDVVFLACWDSDTVIDCTTWATSALLTKEAARALGVVDSGRTLFSWDVAAAGGKGPGGSAWVDERYLSEKGGARGGDGGKGSRAEKKARKKNYQR